MSSNPTSVPSTSVQISDENGSFLVSRPGPAIIHLEVGGRSVEDLKEALTHELETDFVIQGRLTLFIDARQVAATEMLQSASWARWFRTHRPQIERVVALVPAAFAKTTGQVALGAGGLGDTLEILLDANAFERTQVLALRSVFDSGTWDRAEVVAAPTAAAQLAGPAGDPG